MKPFVVAIVATYNRPGELQRLLNSLNAHAPEVGAIVVVDNGSSAETRVIVEGWSGPSIYMDPGRNLGCGGGLRLAGETAWERFHGTLTHIAILDDDAEMSCGAVARLLDGMKSTGADAGSAMIVDAQNRVGWVPGLTSRVGRDAERQRLTPEEYISAHSDTPVSFTWAQGICLLVTRELLASEGFHRDDFWVRGEDLEYSLRLTARRRGVWVPGAVVKHLPPPESPQTGGRGEYLKHCAMLQNVAYIAFRLPHGHRILRTVPSNLLRFLRTWGIAAAADAVRALWRGAVTATPAGKGKKETFFDRSRQALSATGAPAKARA